MKPIRTNSAYAQLAYRRAIIQRAITHLHRTYLGDELSEPKETLTCDMVLPVDADIPQEAIHAYIESLRDEVSTLEAQMRRFEFRAVGDHEPKRKKDAGRHQQKGGH